MLPVESRHLIVDGGEVDFGVRDDGAEGCRIEAIIGEKALGGIQDSLLGVYFGSNAIHTTV